MQIHPKWSQPLSIDRGKWATGSCKVCHEQFHYRETWGDIESCFKCENVWQYMKSSAKTLAENNPGMTEECRVCGLQFIPSHWNTIACDMCSDGLLRQRESARRPTYKPEQRECTECDNVYTSSNPRRLTCSTRCSRRRSSRQESERQKNSRPLYTRSCKNCEKEFETKYPHAVTCGTEKCKRGWRNKRKQMRGQETTP